MDAAYARLYKSPEGLRALTQWYDETLAQLPVPVESRYVTTRHGRTHLLAAGPADAPPLVLIQGYGAASPLWKKQLADFSAAHRVYALDTIGQPGRSDPVTPSLFGDGYAEWLVDVLDALGLERAALAGVCFGGWILMKLAAYAPARVERAVLLTPVGLARFKIYWRSGIPLVLRRDDEEAGARLLRMAFTPPGSGLSFDRDVARALLLVIRHYNVGAIAGMKDGGNGLRELWDGARALFKFVRAEPDSALRRMRAPTLLLVGQHEASYNPQAAVRKARRAMPQVIAEVVPNTGHAAMYDRPDYVNPRVLRFLHDGT